MRSDLIETFRSLKGLDRVNAARMLPLSGEFTIRDHSLRITLWLFKTEVRRIFFTLRFVSL